LESYLITLVNYLSDDCSEYKSKHGILLDQLQTATVNLPLVQVHHILSSLFVSRAGKHDFLRLSAYIVERLALIVQASMPKE